MSLQTGNHYEHLNQIRAKGHLDRTLLENRNHDVERAQARQESDDVVYLHRAMRSDNHQLGAPDIPIR